MIYQLNVFFGPDCYEITVDGNLIKHVTKIMCDSQIRIDVAFKHLSQELQSKIIQELVNHELTNELE
jgi:hypothetical protein